MNKAQTVKMNPKGEPAGAGGAGQGGQGGPAKPRRLGRGLSSLLGTPVAVEIPGAGAGAGVEARGGEAPPSGGGVVEGSGAGAAGTASSGQGAAAAAQGVGADAGSEVGRVVQVDVQAVVPSPFQPRRVFDDAALGELAASIRSAGVVQPILVRRGAGAVATGGSARYELVAGERRWRAAQAAGLARVPAVVAELSDEQAAEWALIENVQRADLSPMEQAYAVRALCDRFGLTHAQAGERLGLDRTTITNLVRLTELEDEVRELIEQGRLTAGHGKILLGVSPGPRRVHLAKKAASEGWSVRRMTSAIRIAAARVLDGKAFNMEAALEGMGQGASSSAGGGERDGLVQAGLKELEKQLSEHLGTKVQVRTRRGGTRGELRVQFYDLDHFDGLMAKMGFVMR